MTAAISRDRRDPTDAVLTALAPELEARIGAFRREHRQPSVAAGLATAEGLRWWHASGFVDLETGQRPDDRTLYRIGSITKTLTATALLQLRDAGDLRLDDPAVRFLPELRAVDDPFGSIEELTIRRLLMHTSGLQVEVPWRDHERVWGYRPDELLEVLPLARVVAPPEAEAKYSNFGYELLGLVVARVARRPFTDHVRDAILTPLAMIDTTWELDEEQRTRQATGYDPPVHDDRPSVARDYDPGVGTPVGGLWSTLRDLGHWVGQQLRAAPDLERGSGQVLAGRTLQEMHRPRYVADPAWTLGVGLAWYATRSGETILVGHNGGSWGFSSNVSFLPSIGIGAIVLLNGRGPAALLSRELVETTRAALRTAADRREPDAPPPPVPHALAPLLGTYSHPELQLEFLVEWRAGALVLRIGGPQAPPHPLEPTDDPLQFTIRGGRPEGEVIVFLRGPEGRIDRCNLDGYPAVRVDLVRPPTWR